MYTNTETDQSLGIDRNSSVREVTNCFEDLLQRSTGRTKLSSTDRLRLKTAVRVYREDGVLAQFVTDALDAINTQSENS